MAQKNQKLSETRRVYDNSGAVTMTIAKAIAEKANIRDGSVVLQELQSDGTVLIKAIWGADNK